MVPEPDASPPRILSTPLPPPLVIARSLSGSQLSVFAVEKAPLPFHISVGTLASYITPEHGKGERVWVRPKATKMSSNIAGRYKSARYRCLAQSNDTVGRHAYILSQVF